MRHRGNSAGRSLAGHGGAFALILVLSACRASGAPPGPDAGPLRAATATEAAAATLPAYAQAGVLAVHQVNVEQGDCTLIVGPDGTTLLIDAGNRTKGSAHVVPYLASIGIHPSDGLDFVIATHGDEDHLGGLDEVLLAGYDVRQAVWTNGSTKPGDEITAFHLAAQNTTAGSAQPIPLGHVIPLGDGATATCVAVHGEVLGHGLVTGATAENDLSIAILVQHGEFDYLTAGDLGGGQSAGSRTGRRTGQADVETPLAISLMPGGGAQLLGIHGIEVLDVNHYGSESSTNSQTMNLLTPAVAVINVGPGQGSNFHHPRAFVVESVLMAQAPCITAPPALVVQTDEGHPVGAGTSLEGFCVGDVVIQTTGRGTFHVSAGGRVTAGLDERAAAGLLPSGRVFMLDGAALGQADSLVITEIMFEPAAVADVAGEWFELHNPGTTAVDLNGWTIRDDGVDRHVIAADEPLLVPPGGFVVLGRNGDPAQNGGYLPEYVYTGLNLANQEDELELVDPAAVLIDRVAYRKDAGWPMQAGRSMALSEVAADNGLALNWTASDVRGGRFAAVGSDLGMPGASQIIP